MFPEKTPEESDDVRTPHENKAISHIPGRNNRVFLTVLSRNNCYFMIRNDGFRPVLPWGWIFLLNNGDNRSTSLIPSVIHRSARLGLIIVGVGIVLSRNNGE